MSSSWNCISSNPNRKISNRFQDLMTRDRIILIRNFSIRFRDLSNRYRMTSIRNFSSRGHRKTSSRSRISARVGSSLIRDRNLPVLGRKRNVRSTVSPSRHWCDRFWEDSKIFNKYQFRYERIKKGSIILFCKFKEYLWNETFWMSKNVGGRKWQVAEKITKPFLIAFLALTFKFTISWGILFFLTRWSI